MTQPKEYLRARELEGKNELLDLQDEIDGLREQAAEHGIGGKTLAKLPGLSVVLVLLNEGHDLEEHSVDGPAMVQVLEGEITLNVEGESVRISADHAGVMAAGTPHDVHAETDSILLLTFNEQGENS
jgi:quercetin dioxygenase-like cupin family protein